ncbi:MAG: hypothetical protein ACYC3B_03695 [Sedimentisphaerales bacterium]
MHEANLFLVFIERLNKSKIAYMTTGSVASIIYGQPRVTHDIDLVLGLHISNISRLVEAFPADEFYCPPLDVIKIEMARKTDGHFNLIHHETGFKADIYPVGQDELHIWAMANRKKIKIEECEVWLAPPEYVIIRKLQYFKEGGSSKHLSDIKNMLEISCGEINMTELKFKIKDYHLADEWEKLCKAGL